jgi:uncharacterized membrane protein
MTVSRFRTILYIVVAIVSLAGLADAAYLTVQALTGETAVCGGSPDCFRVLGSSYAKVAGIPVAAFGSLAYFSVFSFATFAGFSYARARLSDSKQWNKQHRRADKEQQVPPAIENPWRLWA